jgi:hypothetical protein
MPDFESPDLGQSPPYRETASLPSQTPGLDKTRKVRDLAVRGASWARERPAAVIGVLGGLLVAGLGLFLALRARRPTRIERFRDGASDLWDRLRAKLA